MTGPLGCVTGVVVSHNSGQALLGRLRNWDARSSLAACWLVDSGSEDGVPEVAGASVPGLKVRRFDRNVGPCVTRNAGLKLAQTEWVLLLDDDTEVDRASLQRLLSVLLDHPDVAMVGPSVAFAESGRVQYEGGACHYAGLPHMLRHGEPWIGGSPRDVDILTSTCLLVRRDAVLSVGGFDESFFYLMEDVDLSWRLRQAGFRLLVVPEARASNAGASAGLSLKGTSYPARRAFLHARNRGLMLGSLLEAQTLVVLWAPLLFFEVAWCGFALLSGRWGAYLAGKRELMALLPTIWRNRRARRSGRRVPDRHLLGAPPLTLTSTAKAQPLAASAGRMVDGVMRMFFIAARGWLR